MKPRKTVGKELERVRNEQVRLKRNEKMLLSLDNALEGHADLADDLECWIRMYNNGSQGWEDRRILLQVRNDLFDEAKALLTERLDLKFECQIRKQRRHYVKTREGYRSCIGYTEWSSPWKDRTRIILTAVNNHVYED